MKNWKTLLLGVAMVANTSFAAPQVVDKVAAVVNNGVVLESDVDGLMKSVKLNSGEAGQQLPDDATLRHQILERLIMDQIVLQMGQKMGVKITDEQLDQAIANIAKQNNMSLDQMRSRLAYDGISYATYRNQIRKEMLISEVRNNEVRRRVTILPQEVDALAKQVGNQNDASTELNLSHILIPLPENPTSDQAAEAKASGIRRPLQVDDGGQKTGQSRRKQDRDKKLRLLQHICHLDLWRPDEVGQGGPHPVDAVAHNPQSVGRPSDAQVGGPGGNPCQADRHRDPN